MEMVRDILRTKGKQVWHTKPESSVYDALQLMAQNDIGAVLVLDRDKVAGIFSERDYARKVVLQGKSSRGTEIRDVMTVNVVTVGPGNTIGDCMRIMTEKRIRHLPVLEDGVLIGLISIGDVVKSIIADQQFTIGHLEDYISGRR
jgi:CBS domain-containing protein